MKILVVSDFFPDPSIPGGASTRVYHLMRELTKKHKVTLLTTRWPGVPIDENVIKNICDRVIFYDFVEKQTRKPASLFNERLREIRHVLFEYPNMVQGVRRHGSSFKRALNGLNLREFDLIQVEDSYIAYRLFGTKKRYSHIPIVVDLHNINSLMEKRNFELAKGWRWRTYLYFEWKKMVRYEKRVFRAFDLLLTCSEEDRKTGQVIAPNARFTVIPNGVDTKLFNNIGQKAEHNSIFFLGSDWPPNVDGLLYFSKYIYPNIIKYIPDVRFYIIGNFSKNEEVKALADKNTILTGYVKDVREWMGRGAVSVVPLRMGGGTRLKILEAFSMGKTVVSTSMGAEGIEAVSGENIIIADEPKDFAYAVISLLRDRQLCDKLGQNGRRLVEKKYDWKVIGEKLNSAYELLLTTPNSLLTTKSRSILYLLDIFPTISETFIMNEILELERKGFGIQIFTRRKEGGVSHDLLKNLKANIVYLPDAHKLKAKELILSHLKIFILYPAAYIKTLIYALQRRQKGLFWFFKVSCVYANLALKYNFSQVHSHFASMASSYAMFISKLLGKPFTFTIHGWYDLYEAPPSDLAERAETATKVITISNYNKRYLVNKFKIPADKIEVIHCGVDLEYFGKEIASAASQPRNDDEKMILSVARLHPVKNLTLLIKACGLLAKRGNGFKCAIVGDGDERQRLEDLIDNLGLGTKVVLLGTRKLEEVRELYRKASIFVLPSKHETMGVTTMEAMASGLPVISTNIYGIPELVDDSQNGFLISPEDEGTLAAHLEDLLNDDTKRARFGEMGRKKIEKEFNLASEVNKLIGIWANGKN